MSTKLQCSSRNDKISIIYYHYKDLMQYIANDILHDYHSAEDAVSLALFRISENIDSVGDIYSAQTKNFVSLVTKNVAIDMYRKHAKTEFISLDALVADFSSAEPSVKPHEYENITELVSTLSDDYKKAFLLRYGEGYTIKEIAQIMHCSEAKASKLISRARDKLRKLL